MCRRLPGWRRLTVPATTALHDRPRPGGVRPQGSLRLRGGTPVAGQRPASYCARTRSGQHHRSASETRAIARPVGLPRCLPCPRSSSSAARPPSGVLNSVTRERHCERHASLHQTRRVRRSPRLHEPSPRDHSAVHVTRSRPSYRSARSVPRRRAAARFHHDRRRAPMLRQGGARHAATRRQAGTRRPGDAPLVAACRNPRDPTDRPVAISSRLCACRVNLPAVAALAFAGTFGGRCRPPGQASVRWTGARPAVPRGHRPLPDAACRRRQVRAATRLRGPRRAAAGQTRRASTPMRLCRPQARTGRFPCDAVLARWSFGSPALTKIQPPAEG